MIHLLPFRGSMQIIASIKSIVLNIPIVTELHLMLVLAFTKSFWHVLFCTYVEYTLFRSYTRTSRTRTWRLTTPTSEGHFCNPALMLKHPHFYSHSVALIQQSRARVRAFARVSDLSQVFTSAFKTSVLPRCLAPSFCDSTYAPLPQGGPLARGRFNAQCKSQ